MKHFGFFSLSLNTWDVLCSFLICRCSMDSLPSWRWLPVSHLPGSCLPLCLSFSPESPSNLLGSVSHLSMTECAIYTHLTVPWRKWSDEHLNEILLSWWLPSWRLPWWWLLLFSWSFIVLLLDLNSHVSNLIATSPEAWSTGLLKVDILRVFFSRLYHLQLK